jgi:hypothetical protein
MVVALVDIIGAIAFGWSLTATPENSFCSQSRSIKGAITMRSAHAEYRLRDHDNPGIRSDFRHGLGIVLPMDSQAATRPLAQTGNKARSVIFAIPENSDRRKMSISRRLDCLERKMAALGEAMDMMEGVGG